MATYPVRIANRILALVLCLAGCAINPDGPAAPGSPAAEELAAIAVIEQQALEIQVLSEQLTVLVDESRRGVDEGRASAPEEIAKMRALMDQIAEKDAALQAEILALEARVHAHAGDPTPAENAGATEKAGE